MRLINISKEVETALLSEIKNRENFNKADLLYENGLIEYTEREIRKTFEGLKNDLEDLLFEWENALIDGINSDEEQKPSKIISNGIEIISKGIFEKE